MPGLSNPSGGEESAKRSWYDWGADGTDVSALGPWGQAVWHRGPSGGSYLGVFSDGMPDLNLDSPDVRAELIRIGQYWLGLGLDGYRLDAAKHVYEDFQSSSADPATSRKNVAWWKQFRQGVSENGREPYLVGEVWDTTAVVGPFLDKALDSALNFEAAKLVLDAVKTGDASSLASVLARQLAYYSKVSGGRFVDAPFLGNHDQNRVMSELGGDVERAKLAAALLLTLPGNPFLYYGEEIGMKGAKPDERIREPMIWAKDRSSGGQTSWEPATENDGTPSAEQQLADPDSLLSRYKLLIGWRNDEPALGDGGFAPFEVEQDGILAFARVSASSALLVVHNLTGEARTVDLSGGGATAVGGIRFATDGASTSFASGKLRLAALRHRDSAMKAEGRIPQGSGSFFYLIPSIKETWACLPPLVRSDKHGERSASRWGVQMLGIVFASIVVIVTALGLSSYQLAKSIIRDKMSLSSQQTLEQARDKLDFLLSMYGGTQPAVHGRYFAASGSRRLFKDGCAPGGEAGGTGPHRRPIQQYAVRRAQHDVDTHRAENVGQCGGRCLRRARARSRSPTAARHGFRKWRKPRERSCTYRRGTKACSTTLPNRR
ncbi:alpha-amylase family glycosyl hydrolase [Cohnella rhizosphaerae]|uniref:Alpha-amylase family glycosyl hydrolase n=1 Tax=Cohnella rhizosphaerae TaxID=1457232 RepID=A0A9X4QTA5_9BACL|nr:alpha-amylase family glycosyl hydrolase [Cohnella rhizosphaerae]MDG0810194.1 alpha-amylase family glycosyl hydrolase [Cohnella rhizosphaerae]